MSYTMKSLVGAASLLLLSTGMASAYPAIALTDLNIRAGQGTGYRVIGVMPRGARVDVSGCGDGWCYVSNYGGYASASYLDTGGYASAAPFYGRTYYPYHWRPHRYWRHHRRWW